MPKMRKATVAASSASDEQDKRNTIYLDQCRKSRKMSAELFLLGLRKKRKENFRTEKAANHPLKRRRTASSRISPLYESRYFRKTGCGTQ